MSTSFYTRPNRFPPIVKNLIIINVLVWLAQIVFHNDFQLTSKLALYPIDSQDFEPYQIATHMFAHSAVQVYSDGSWAPVFYHIFFNMFNLFVFGSMLENVWGSKRFLIFYLVCGVGAAAVHLLVQHLQFDASLVQQANYLYYQGREAEAVNLYRSMDFLRPAVGASGAVMGIMAGAAMLSPIPALC